jgi:hypothetical protein
MCKWSPDPNSLAWGGAVTAWRVRICNMHFKAFKLMATCETHVIQYIYIYIYNVGRSSGDLPCISARKPKLYTVSLQNKIK